MDLESYIDATDWTAKQLVLSIVLLLLATRVTISILAGYRNYRADKAFSDRHGCLAPPQRPNRWPCGLDQMKEMWDSNAEGRILEHICSMTADYEPRDNLSQYILFGPRVFWTLHPLNVETILSTKFKDYGFGDRASVFAPLLGEGIFTQEGAAWKHSRELLRKQFARIPYQNMEPFQEYGDNLISLLPDEGIVDLQPLFFSLTLDTTTALLLGKSVNSLKAGPTGDSEHTKFGDYFNEAQDGLTERFRLAPWHWLYSPSSFRRACAAVHKFLDDYIDKWSSEKEKVDSQEPGTFIDRVAEESASNESLRNQLLNVLLAGRDTTACNLTWIFRLLVRHESVMKRLREEIKSVMGNERIPRREHIRRMLYLDMVIKESLRLYPSVPVNSRTALRATTLPTGGGPDGTSPILVRKDEVVIFSPYVNSRKKHIYGPDACDFRPERWETGELADIGWAYFPFNGGPRICLGKDYALMLASYIVVRIIQDFDCIVLPPGEKNEPPGTEKQRLTLVLSSADGCRIQLTRRAPA